MVPEPRGPCPNLQGSGGELPPKAVAARPAVRRHRRLDQPDGLAHVFGVRHGHLVAHEFGHYFAAQHHLVPATLPYFIPVPFFFGTMGAIIRMSPLIPNRRALLTLPQPDHLRASPSPYPSASSASPCPSGSRSRMTSPDSSSGTRCCSRRLSGSSSVRQPMGPYC